MVNKIAPNVLPSMIIHSGLFGLEKIPIKEESMPSFQTKNYFLVEDMNAIQMKCAKCLPIHQLHIVVELKHV